MCEDKKRSFKDSSLDEQGARAKLLREVVDKVQEKLKMRTEEMQVCIQFWNEYHNNAQQAAAATARALDKGLKRGTNAIEFELEKLIRLRHLSDKASIGAGIWRKIFLITGRML